AGTNLIVSPSWAFTAAGSKTIACPSAPLLSILISISAPKAGAAKSAASAAKAKVVWRALRMGYLLLGNLVAAVLGDAQTPGVDTPQPPVGNGQSAAAANF